MVCPTSLPSPKHNFLNLVRLRLLGDLFRAVKATIISHSTLSHVIVKSFTTGVLDIRVLPRHLQLLDLSLDAWGEVVLQAPSSPLSIKKLYLGKGGRRVGFIYRFDWGLKSPSLCMWIRVSVSVSFFTSSEARALLWIEGQARSVDPSDSISISPHDLSKCRVHSSSILFVTIQSKTRILLQMVTRTIARTERSINHISRSLRD
jgi:hypothetical protein